MQDAGKISHEVAKQLAEDHYETFAEQRRIECEKQPSDFDALLDKSKQLPKK